MEKPFEVAYNSDLIIRDASEAATLCLFYDRVVLPYTDRESSRDLIGRRGVRTEYEYEIAQWEVTYGTLFDSGVISRLPAIGGHKKMTQKKKTRIFLEFPKHAYAPGEPGFDRWEFQKFDGDRMDLVHDGRVFQEIDGDKTGSTQESDLPEDRFGFDELQEGEEILHQQSVYVNAWDRYTGPEAKRRYRCKLLTARRTIFVSETDAIDLSVGEHISDLLSIHIDKYESGDAPLIRLDLARHLLRSDISIPQIFALSTGRSRRDILVALEAAATFRYLLPKISTFHPIQILELREKLKDSREGFTMHLWKLSKGLQEQAKDGTSLADISRSAEDLIKTELIPDYREFQRQLESIRSERWGKVLDAAGRVAEIDAAPWTPKFWALVLKAIGMTALTADSERKEALSNRYQAFQFMSYVEQAAIRI